MTTAENVDDLGSISDMDFSRYPTAEVCRPGLDPIEYNVIVALPEVKKQTRGGIIIPEQKQDIMGLAQQTGMLVAVSPAAFNYEDWPEGTNPPQVGDVVWFGRYAGRPFIGADGRSYRIFKDKDIGAVITAAVGKVGVQRQGVAA